MSTLATAVDWRAPLFVNGAWVDGAESVPVFDKFTGAQIGICPKLDSLSSQQRAQHYVETLHPLSICMTIAYEHVISGAGTRDVRR